MRVLIRQPVRERQSNGLSRRCDRFESRPAARGLTVGPQIIDRAVKKKMATALKNIQSGKFAREWTRETETGQKRYQKLLDAARRHPIEKIGARIRGMMAWSHKP